MVHAGNEERRIVLGFWFTATVCACVCARCTDHNKRRFLCRVHAFCKVIIDVRQSLCVYVRMWLKRLQVKSVKRFAMALKQNKIHLYTRYYIKRNLQFNIARNFALTNVSLSFRMPNIYL